MIKFINELFKSRLWQYLFYALIYFIWWKIAGFELTSIVLMATILGELTYQDIKNTKNK